MKLWRTTRLCPIALLVSGFFVSLASTAEAQTTVTWTGSAWPNDIYTDNQANWLGNTLPLNDGTEHFVFGQAFENMVYFATAINANKVSIVGITSPFLLDDDNDYLNLGAGGLVYAPALPVTSYIGAYPGVNLVADQTWDIQSGELGFYYDSFEGSGRLTKIGAGTLNMSSPNIWTGGITLNAGRLALDTDMSTNWTLGTGNLIVGPPPGGLLTPTIVTRASGGYEFPITVTNAVELNGVLAAENEVELHLTGEVTLKADTTFAPKGDYLFLDGAISEAGGARKLILDSAGALILGGANTYTGGTHVEKGVLVFAELVAIPANPATSALTNSVNGYIGIGDDTVTSTSNPQANFIDRFNKAASFGTIGFDTDPDVFTTTSFTGAIDLTGFAATARLGSATKAILSSTAVITPQGTAYRFGGGGGWLQVDSLLTGSRSLVLDSPSALPLTVRLNNSNNDYNGGTSVTHSALIFGSSLGNIPGSAGSILINQGGYVGFEYWGDQTEADLIANSLAKINSASTGMVGFETSTSSAINLGSYTGGIYLGTSDPVSHDGDYYGGIELSGLISTGNAGTDPYRFAGYKGGRLIVSSPLTGNAGVSIGDPASPATFGDPVQEEHSSVNLAADNSGLTGNITLYGGRLEVDQGAGVVGTNPSTALGGGDLIVQGMSLPNEWQEADYSMPLPQLAAGSTDLIIANDILLNSNLELGGYHAFNLAGTISGAGGLFIEPENDFSTFNFHLGGNNTFSGGTYVHGNNSSSTYLWLDHNKATGTGPLSFGSTGNIYVKFNTTAPEIGGLSTKTGDENVQLYATLTNTVLTINQSADSTFHGEFRSALTNTNDNLRIVKAGAGMLRLDSGGMYFYNGTTEAALPGSPQVSLQIDQGTLALGNNFYVGETSATTFWIHGGTLVLEYAELTNPIVVDNGGRLAGNGYLSANINIGAGATLSPGLTSNTQATIGVLDFDHLALLGGGTLEWDILKADETSNAWDKIFVYTPATLDFTGINLSDPASASTRFTLKVISRQLDGSPGLLADFNPTQGYSWLIFDTEAIAGFDPAKVILDTSLFANSLLGGPGGNGAFSLTQNGNMLFLNFSPVPEPSTYALMLAGLAAAALGYGRRKNRP